MRCSSAFGKITSNIPFLNLSYDGQEQTNTRTRLEAFMYQVQQVQAAGRQWELTMSTVKKLLINAIDPEEYRVALIERRAAGRILYRDRRPGTDSGQYLQGGGGPYRTGPAGGLY